MKRKQLFILLILFLFFYSPIVTSNRIDYGYEYNPFKYLPDFPTDFYDVKNMFSTQDIRADQLNNSYLQPEILPTWENCYKKIYYNNSLYANNGIFLYPSRFDIFYPDVNQSFRLSTLVYAQPGCSIYQGATIYPVFNQSLANVSIVSDDVLVLSPTYPYFITGWMQCIIFDITILQEHMNITVSLRERDPPEDLNNAFIDEYGITNYSACPSILSESIDRCIIQIHGKPLKQNIVNNDIDDNNVFIIYLEYLLLILFGTLGVLKVYRYVKERREEKKQMH